jgi:hypothetical protein
MRLEAIRVRTGGLTTSQGFRPASIAHPLGDHAAFQLTDTADHLADEGAHRIVRIIAENLSPIDAEHCGAGHPSNLQRSLLDVQSTRQTVQSWHQ